MTSGHDSTPGAEEYILPFSRAVRFHGHICPGLAIGYYASHIGMRWLHGHKCTNSDVVVVAESAGCSLDAVQAITGCTVGKGSLIVRDHGKQAFTFMVRGSGRGLRVSLRPDFTVDSLDPEIAGLQEKASHGTITPEEAADLHSRIERVCHAILESPGDRVFDIREVEEQAPAAETRSGEVVCSRCGEPVSLGRAKKTREGWHCQPCQQRN